jgi:hypothetical protein
MLEALENGVNGGKVHVSFAQHGLFTLKSSPRPRQPASKEDPPTGEPDAGDPPVRFGGRGDRANRLSLPLSETGVETALGA